MRRRLLEDVHPVAELAEVAAGARHLRLALDQDQDHFAVARRLGRDLSRLQAVEAEADVATSRPSAA